MMTQMSPPDRIYDLVDVLEEQPKDVARDMPPSETPPPAPKAKMAFVSPGLQDEMMKTLCDAAEKAAVEKVPAIVERIAREMIPDIAERIIREEIENIKRS